MSILSVIQPYAKIKRLGLNYCCPCPFHETDQDAMRLLPSADWFECPECGRSGNSRELSRLLAADCPDGRLCVYVLLLKNAHFYVGLTQNLKKRVLQHYTGVGAVWTRKYQPLEVLEVFPNGSFSLENKITREYRNRYGQDRVRGGIYI